MICVMVMKFDIFEEKLNALGYVYTTKENPLCFSRKGSAKTTVLKMLLTTKNYNHVNS